jgi:hypothetical protein
MERLARAKGYLGHRACNRGQWGGMPNRLSNAVVAELAVPRHRQAVRHHELKNGAGALPGLALSSHLLGAPRCWPLSLTHCIGEGNPREYPASDFGEGLAHPFCSSACTPVSTTGFARPTRTAHLPQVLRAACPQEVRPWLWHPGPATQHRPAGVASLSNRHPIPESA